MDIRYYIKRNHNQREAVIIVNGMRGQTNKKAYLIQKTMDLGRENTKSFPEVQVNFLMTSLNLKMKKHYANIQTQTTPIFQTQQNGKNTSSHKKMEKKSFALKYPVITHEEIMCTKL